jgi:hypothetical protein
MQLIEWLLGASPDGGSGLLESWLFCLVCALFGLGARWKYRIKRGTDESSGQ